MTVISPEISAALLQGLDHLTAFGPRRQADVVATVADVLDQGHIPLTGTVQHLRATVTALEQGLGHLTGVDSPFLHDLKPLLSAVLEHDQFQLNYDVTQRLAWLLAGLGEVRQVPFPYQVLSDGGYCLPSNTPLCVAVLGDVSGRRTTQLVREGHRVIHLDRDPPTTRGVRDFVAPSLGDQGKSVYWCDDPREPIQADLVEAYDLINPRRARDEAYLQGFVTDEMLTRLAPGADGKGMLVVSEEGAVIEGLGCVVATDTHLLSLEVVYHKPAPLPGGLVATGSYRGSWLVFRRKV